MDLFWKVSSKAKEILAQKQEAGENPEETKDETPVATGVQSEKPTTTLGEIQHESFEKEISPVNEPVEPEKIASPDPKEPDQPPGDADSANAKAGISTGDLKDVSHKAVESAKSIGSFLYGIANKTGRTLSETAKHLKTTVEENSILGDFNKEQEAFMSSKSAKSDEQSVPPWVGAEDEEALKQQILSLSADKRNFLRSPPAGVLFDFNFDDMYPVAKMMLKEDSALEKMRFEIVPKLINEENFWRNYFYRVSLVKQSSRLSKGHERKSSSGESSASEKSSPVESMKDMQKTTAENEIGADSDATDSPNHEFVSDTFQSDHVSEWDIKQGMKLLGVKEKVSSEDDWEKEIQQELQEYEVVAEGNDDPEWENEIEQMLHDKVKDVV